MSFARAFSLRRNKPEMQISTPIHMGRAASQRGGKPVLRTQISSPTALISTSNAQVYNAHSINGRSPVEIRNCSPSSASSSGDDSDASTGSIHSRETVTDASSVDDSSPIMTEPEPNHLTCYFKPSDVVQSPLSSPTSSSRPSLDTPRIPQRAPSHSKKAHEGLHRKRSIQRMLSPPPSRGNSVRETRSSTEIFSPAKTTFVEAPRENPFGKELAQLDEVAEEFGQAVKKAEKDVDELHMDNRGLARFTASEYHFEIQGLIHEMFQDEQPTNLDFGFF